MNKTVVVVVSILAGVVILILATGLLGLSLITKTIDDAVSPIRSANQALEEQMNDLLNPTPTILPDPVTIVHEVQALARLETMQYTVEKLITAEIGQTELGFLFGDRLLFVAHGVVIAGIDLGKMAPEDIQVGDGQIRIKLPEPEVFVAALDNDKSYVYDRETGLLTKGDANLESGARASAEEEIRKAAIEDGILEKADLNAKSFLKGFFEKFGYTTVVFEN